MQESLRAEKQMNNQRFTFACSFSGGKDSCLALYRAIHAGGDAKNSLQCLLRVVSGVVLTAYTSQ